MSLTSSPMRPCHFMMLWHGHSPLLRFILRFLSNKSIISLMICHKELLLHANTHLTTVRNTRLTHVMWRLRKLQKHVPRNPVTPICPVFVNTGIQRRSRTQTRQVIPPHRYGVDSPPRHSRRIQRTTHTPPRSKPSTQRPQRTRTQRTHYDAAPQPTRTPHPNKQRTQRAQRAHKRQQRYDHNTAPTMHDLPAAADSDDSTPPEPLPVSTVHLIHTLPPLPTAHEPPPQHATYTELLQYAHTLAEQDKNERAMIAQDRTRLSQKIRTLQHAESLSAAAIQALNKFDLSSCQHTEATSILEEELSEPASSDYSDTDNGIPSTSDAPYITLSRRWHEEHMPPDLLPFRTHITHSPAYDGYGAVTHRRIHGTHGSKSLHCTHIHSHMQPSSTCRTYRTYTHSPLIHTTPFPLDGSKHGPGVIQWIEPSVFQEWTMTTHAGKVSTYPLSARLARWTPLHQWRLTHPQPFGPYNPTMHRRS